jgi:hypothetical protein
MYLHRVTDRSSRTTESPNFGQEADGLEITAACTINGELAAIAKFDRFGSEQRASDFKVELHWSDVEELISASTMQEWPEL